MEKYTKGILKRFEAVHKISLENPTKIKLVYVLLHTMVYIQWPREKTIIVGDQDFIFRPSLLYKLLSPWNSWETIIQLNRPNSLVVKLGEFSTKYLDVNIPLAKINHIGFFLEGILILLNFSEWKFFQPGHFLCFYYFKYKWKSLSPKTAPLSGT